jgi:hypothetical protein
MRWLRSTLVAATLAVAVVMPAGAQTLPPPPDQTRTESSTMGEAETPDVGTQLHQMRHAAVRLPLAAALACVLALRPRRRGSPKRQPAVIETQIILAVVGAMVMLVVGSSLARAFGIVGAAGLVRYRAKIEDPKDAGVMLSTLAVGLASGVGIYMLAAFATVFIMVVLWIIESFEPRATQIFMLKVKAKNPAALQQEIETLLNRYKLTHEHRASSTEEIEYEVKMPIDRKADRLSSIIMKLDTENVTSVEWDEKKPKK